MFNLFHPVHQLVMNSFLSANIKERRHKRRFVIEQEIRYRLLCDSPMVEAEVGRVLNISSKGVFMTAARTLRPGLTVELSIAWPALLNNVCPLKLVIWGCVLRSNEKGAAISIEQYEFRTNSSHRLDAQPILPVDSKGLGWCNILSANSKPARAI